MSFSGAWASRTPKSVLALSHYNWAQFGRDATAGVTVGLVALPLAMAFSIASGMPPEAGLYCAIVAGFLISALGGSMTQIGGPTGAFVVVVAGIVSKYGVDGLMMCTLLAGIMLVILGATGMGTVIQFIPRPVVIGFTNGIAILIASTQVRDFFGLGVDKVPGEFLHRMEVLLGAWRTVNPVAMTVAVFSLAGIIVIRRLNSRIPATVVTLAAATTAAWFFGLHIETIQSRFGEVPRGLPRFHVPTFRPDLILTLLSPAITVAMLGAIESLLSAVVADRMTGDRHEPNVELIAQGIANIASPLAGGLPATGAIARTATNIRSGARTPVAGMLHAVTLLLVLLFATPLAGLIPLSVLAAILVTVAWNMGEWQEIPEILRLGWPSIIVWSITFLLTVVADLTVAVEAGMIFSALIFIRKVTTTTTVSRVTGDDIEQGRKHSLQLHGIPENVAIYRIHGPFLFGATRKLDVIERQLPQLPPVIILRLRNMTAIDSTGLHALESLADKIHASGRRLIVCGMRSQPRRLLLRGGFGQKITKQNVCLNVRDALARAQTILGGSAPQATAG